jgi:hypothetical protein
MYMRFELINIEYICIYILQIITTLYEYAFSLFYSNISRQTRTRKKQQQQQQMNSSFQIIYL